MKIWNESWILVFWIWNWLEAGFALLWKLMNGWIHLSVSILVFLCLESKKNILKKKKQNGTGWRKKNREDSFWIWVSVLCQDSFVTLWSKRASNKGLIYSLTNIIFHLQVPMVDNLKMQEDGILKRKKIMSCWNS